MEKINIAILTSITNRTITQTKFLLSLLDGDYDKLITLERKLKNNFYCSCPGTKEEIEEILSIKKDRIESYNWINIDLIRNLSNYDNIIQHKVSKKYGTIKNILIGKEGSYPDQYGIYWLGWRENIPIMKYERIFFPYEQTTMPYWTNQEMVDFITNKFDLKI